MTSVAPSPPRVFISYSHDSREHCDRVLALAQQLRRDGIDAELDQFHNCEIVHWPSWCAEQLRPDKSRFVLCVCTAEYKARIENRVPADVGKGVFWEGRLITDYLYDTKGNERFVPVLFEGEPQSSLPDPLRGWTRFCLSTFQLEDSDPGYEDLYRLMTGRPKVEPEPLGPIKALFRSGLRGLRGLMTDHASKDRPSLQVYERQTDFAALIEKLGNRIDAVGRGVEETKGVALDIKSDTAELLSILREKVPPPSTPSRPHNLPPWMAPDYFIGRVSELGALCEGLSAPGGGNCLIVQPRVVRGAGGIGKTRLAIQAAWILYLQGRYDMAFRLSASSPDELDLQLAGLCERSLLDLYQDREPPRELDVRKNDVIHALRRSAGRWLLFLDGADSREARDRVKQLMDELAGGSFLVTSRRDDWPKGTTVQLPLDVFPPDEARDCLVSRYWKTEPTEVELADFDMVAQELGYLPLALVLAAGYMESRRISPGRYLEMWREKRNALLDYPGEALDEDRSLLAAFDLSFSQLTAPAQSLLSLLSWLAPEPFPRDLVEGSEQVQEVLTTAAEDGISPDPADSLAQLKILSLAQLDENSVQLHRLVSVCTQATLAEDARNTSLLQVVRWIDTILPKTEFDTAGWELWGKLAPHLDHLLVVAPMEGRVARLCNNYGIWLHYQARYQAAEPLMERSLEIVEERFGPDHPDTSIRLNNLAQLLMDTNRLAEAEPLMRRALQIDENSFGPHHPDVAVRLNNLAQLLQATNRLTEAEPLMQRALQVDETSFGANHPNVAMRLNNLAHLLQATERHHLAEPLLRRALQIDEKCLGPHHPDVGRDLNNLAQVLMVTNRLSEAEPVMRRALELTKRGFGPEHPKVAKAINNLAQLLQATNRLTEAEQFMRRALQIDENSFGPHHPDVARDLNNLSGLLLATSRLTEAEPLMRRNLSILLHFTLKTGHMHPHLAAAFENYRYLLQQMSIPEDQISERHAEVGKEAGLDEEGFGRLLEQVFGGKD